jgi:hypothetical protein
MTNAQQSGGCNHVDNHIEMEATSGPTSYPEEEKLNRAEWEAKDAMECLKEEADQCTDASRRLREQADALDRKAKRLRTNAEELDVVRRSLKFDAICLAIRRNDPETITFADDDRLVIDFPEGYAAPLGEALRGNTHVHMLPIYLEALLSGVSNGMTTPSMTAISNVIQPLIEFVLSSTSLRKIMLDGALPCKKSTEALINIFLDAIAQNQGIEELDFINCYAPTGAVVSRIFSLQLKKLLIDFAGADYHSGQEGPLIESVFTPDIALENLRLDINDTRLAAAVLSKLQGSSSLQTLNIGCDLGEASLEYVEAVRNFLLSGNVLQHLGLRGFTFDATSMEILLNGTLQQHGSLWEVSLSRLDFLDCVLDEGAKGSFQKFMRTEVGVAHTGIGETGLTCAALRSSLVTFACDADTLTGSNWTAKSFVSMLCSQRKRGIHCATIGSQIGKLWFLDNYPQSRAFLYELAKQSRRIQLEELTLSKIRGRDCIALARCIAKLDTLRGLCIDDMTDSAQKVHVLRSLRSCGNMRWMHFHGKRFDASLPQAYCERNNFFADLLRDSDESASESSEPLPDIERSLYPTLFQTAKQVPSMKLPVVLQSIMILDQSIGAIET